MKTLTLKGTAFPSLFDGLPLYQGYGLISQHVSDSSTQIVYPSEKQKKYFFKKNQFLEPVVNVPLLPFHGVPTVFAPNGRHLP